MLTWHRPYLKIESITDSITGCCCSDANSTEHVLLYTHRMVAFQRVTYTSYNPDPIHPPAVHGMLCSLLRAIYNLVFRTVLYAFRRVWKHAWPDQNLRFSLWSHWLIADWTGTYHGAGYFGTSDTAALWQLEWGCSLLPIPLTPVEFTKNLINSTVMSQWFCARRTHFCILFDFPLNSGEAPHSAPIPIQDTRNWHLQRMCRVPVWTDALDLCGFEPPDSHVRLSHYSVWYFYRSGTQTKIKNITSVPTQSITNQLNSYVYHFQCNFESRT